MKTFPADYNHVMAQIDAIDPERYARSRNYLDGAVTRLSPYLSRGVISTRLVMKQLAQRGYSFQQVEKLLQELAWRDYYQRVWQNVRETINTDLKNAQEQVNHYQLPSALPRAATGIEAVDASILELFETGYMHNHCRMYLAAICCNIGRSHWLQPARWMYYHLLDGDWASNALSWQWVAGSFSQKKYLANQENINKYTGSRQKGSYLDLSYENLPLREIPEELKEVQELLLQTELPTSNIPKAFETNKPTFIYNYYNLDPVWRREEDGHRILLLEPAVFEKFPIHSNCMNFMMALAGQIPELRVFSGSFDALEQLVGGGPIVYREHPLNSHYRGAEDQREWMVPEVSGYYPSFFSYWRKVEKNIRREFK